MTRHPSPEKFLPPDSNPFATRFTRPGALPFIFEGAEFEGADSTFAMIDRLEQNGWWGQIVGPHGSGKSTLLTQLRSSLAQRNRDVIHLELHENQHKLPAGFFASNDWQARTQLVIDGYEQLGRLSRWRIKRHCRSQHCGLLVTTHVDLGLPTIFTTQTQPETAQRLIAQLLKQQGQGSLMGEGLMDEGSYAPDQIAAALQRHQGNLREVLFELYDLYESNRAV